MSTPQKLVSMIAMSLIMAVSFTGISVQAAPKYMSVIKAKKHTTRNVLRQSMAPGSIIVSFGDRKLYYIQSRTRVKTYPIGIPRKGFEWKGTTRVSYKKKNPRWTPTKRMRTENPNLPEYVEGGTAGNPLGKRALYLGASQYRIHGTPAAWTIGRARSAGCVRMHNRDVIDLYRRTRVGARVLVTWKKYQASPKKFARKIRRSRKKRRYARYVQSSSSRYIAKKRKSLRKKRRTSSKRKQRSKRYKRKQRSKRYKRITSRKSRGKRRTSRRYRNKKQRVSQRRMYKKKTKKSL